MASDNELVHQMTELEKLRHSAAHVLADAVKRTFPTAKLTIGPPVDFGFYYDFDIDQPFTPEVLAQLEKLMGEIVKANLPFTAREISRPDAIKYFQERNEPYKVELIESFDKDAKLTLHSHGEFTDLCRGGHCARTGDIKAFKLLSVAGSYWRGDSKNKMLQRIYGTAFFSKDELAAFVKQREEAEKRDHRKLGKELQLIAFHPWAPGTTFWLPRGATLYQTLSDFMRHQLVGPESQGGGGYVEVRTPMLFNQKLWEKSGHWEHYQDNMYRVIVEEENFGLKPMNCPSHHLIFDMELRSYRDLPMRIHDQGVLHRNEVSGALSGLTRVRQFSQDDGHLYVRPDQIGDEVGKLLALVDKIYKIFDLNYEVKLSTRNPEKFMGSLELWDVSEKGLAAALDKNGIKYRVEPGEGAFYGPKIDFDVTDAIGRKWQCATIQLDYNAPERFELNYIGEDGKKHRPVVIHRAIFGSIERFIAILIEHYAGNFPVWLAPLQARVVVVSDKQEAFAREVEQLLGKAGLKVDVDLGTDKLGGKIRRAQLEKIPYMLVVGDKEVESRTVSARFRDGKQLDPMDLSTLTSYLADLARAPK